VTLLDGAEALAAQADGLCDEARRAICRSHCCHAPLDSQQRIVAVTLPDLIGLVGLIHRPAGQAELETATGRLLAEHCSVSPVTGNYMIVARRGACPYLDAQGRCAVYSARPMLCRIFFHCEWIGGALKLDRELDNAVAGGVLNMAVSLGRYWRGHAGRLWRQPWRYDEVEL